MKSKALMIQGTSSGAGKSLIVAGLCRIFSDLGIRVAPFKAQNMALNSFITKEGGEIGRAQALQAEAARIEPSVDMNPILLKATGEAGSQVIVNGRVYRNMKAGDYYAFKDRAWEAVRTAYDRLSSRYELIVIEGAGSPAEINLMEDEIVNMRVARYADAPVILVGDIDRGGVFASLYGTIELLRNSSRLFNGSKVQNCQGNKERSDADYIRAFIINKFRGDLGILRPGLRMIEERTGRPVIGVINYYGDLGLHEEDGVPLERFERFEQLEPLKIVVLRLRYISNFTDFDPFLYEPDVDLVYSLRKEDINTADLLILPGSKNTVSDLLFLRGHGIEGWIKSAVKKGIPLIGICGGYQMLGRKIYDPYGVESDTREIDGMGLLNTITTLEKTKITSQVEAEIVQKGGSLEDSAVFASTLLHFCTSKPLKGYEIHMGVTTGDTGLFRVLRFTHHDSRFTVVMDGSINGNVWGTYIHGIFDNDHLRRAILNSIRLRKGLEPLEVLCRYDKLRDGAIDGWADIIKKQVDVCFILRLMGLESYQKTYCMRIGNE